MDDNFQSLQWVLNGLFLVGVSGLPGLLVARRSQAGQTVATLLTALGCMLGLVGTLRLLMADTVTSFLSNEHWFLPIGHFRIEFDAITGIFLLPVFVVSLIGSLYGLGYWRPSERPDSAARLQFFYGLLTAALGVLTLARDGVLFLAAWEVMAVSAFLLVNLEDQNEEVRGAAWLYLAASHLATLALFGMFALWNDVTGDFAWTALRPEQASSGQLNAIFYLALLGFGVKAGIMPFHIWLPGAHASAPSHVSAMMSGVLIKMGVYGLVRVTALLPEPPLAWGCIVALLGAASGIFALVLAIGQIDLKRALAYSSIENIGVIFLGLGLALVGRTEQQPAWIVLGMGGALLHVWNHALFKPLLFYCSGSIMHATGTRAVNLMGGLAKPMRWTSLAFLAGSLGACALPPLNGFVSELLIYLGLFQTLTVEGSKSLPALAFAAPALALVGALALALFTQLFGIVFLGAGRSHVVDHAHESPGSMLVPMIPLVALMVWIGVAPQLDIVALFRNPVESQTGPAPRRIVFAQADGSAPRASVVGVIQQGVNGWGGGSLTSAALLAVVDPAEPVPATLAALAPLRSLSKIAMLLVGLITVVAVWYRWRLSVAPVGSSGTWDCGYAQPTARMQYTSSSYGQILIKLFGSALRPRIEGPGVVGLFPQQGRYQLAVVDLVLDRAVYPSVDFFGWLFARARLLQQGIIQIYLLYIFLIILGLLLWS
jgi:hydrogenase-4 component B